MHLQFYIGNLGLGTQLVAVMCGGHAACMRWDYDGDVAIRWQVYIAIVFTCS